MRQTIRPAVNMPDDLIISRLCYGHKIYLDAHDISITPHIITDGYWEPNISSVFINTVKRNQTFVDIGANIGYYTLLAGTRIGKEGKIFAFEPNPRAYSILLKNIDINGLTSFVEAENVALGDINDFRGLRIIDVHRGGASFFRNDSNLHLLYHDKISETVNVAMRTFDHYMIAKEIDHIDAIKIDVEGAEPLVIAGMRECLSKNKSLTIFMEWYKPLLKESCNIEHFAQELVNQCFDLKYISDEGDIETISTDSLLNKEYAILYLNR
ncbi:MAG: FkbM family methyltransferase [Candidatus Nitrosomirales archaeon]|jgi:FkbM family methyltransferase